MSTATQILLPVGRILWGDLYKPRARTGNDGKPKLNQDGTPQTDFSIGYAIAKAGERAWWETAWGAQILAVGQTAFPIPSQNPAFAWKIVDGDSTVPNKNQKKPCDQEGHPGHWVLRLGSSFAPKIYNKEGTQPLLDVGAVKAGYYVQAYISVKGNDSQQSPGLYLNHSLIALQGYGPEISTGPDAASVGFGQTALPAGASTVPTGGMTAPPITGAPAMTPPPPAAAAAPPATYVTPAAAFLAPPAVAAPPPAAPAPPPAASGPQMTAAAKGVTYAAYIAAGWSDAQMRAGGLLV